MRATNARSESEGPDAFAFDGAKALLRAWSNGLRPDPDLTVSEWADKHRWLSSRASAEPGRYRTARTPYMREIMDALSPARPVQRVVFMKAAQVGATEAGNCFIGFVMHHAPGPMLAVQPTVVLAKRNSRQRIDPLIEESLELRARVKPARSRDAGNTMLSKEFAGGILILTGANSAVGLRSTPARYIFLDEVDAYPASADEEGDPVTLAEARSLTFAHRRKVFLVSTPTIRGLSRIEREFDASDLRRYFVPCLHCGEMQWLRFERLRWEKGQPETATYHCEGCERSIAEHHKTVMLAAGEWRATATAADPTTVGCHLSALYSPVGWLSWVHAFGQPMTLTRLAIDTSYETSAVYAWARTAGFAQVAPVKGVESFNRTSPVTGPTYVDATVGGKRLRRGARLGTVATSTFKAETYRFLRQDRPLESEIAVSASLGLPYHLVTGDVRQANYSSLRAELVEFRRRTEQLQYGVIAHQLCRPVWARWLETAVLAGALDLPGYAASPGRFRPVQWIPPRWDWVDPLKDIQAQVLAIEAGLSSRRKAVEATGYDIEEIDRENAADAQRAADLGFRYRTTPGETQGARATPARRPDPDTEEE